MKKLFKKLIASVLCVSALVSFCACNGGKDPSGTGDTTTEAVNSISFDLSKYTLIRPDKMSDNAVSQVVEFRKALNEATGLKLGIQDDWLRDGETDDIKNAYEILVGQTSRSASGEALAGVDNPTAFVIKVTETKLIINSGSEAGLTAGMSYFLTLLNGNTLTLPENYLYVSEGIPVIDVIKNGTSDFTIIFSDSLDNSAVSTNENDRLDLEVVYAKEIKQKLQKLTGVSLTLATDWSKTGDDNSGKYEIIVGATNRPESAEFIKQLGVDGYGYAVIGNKICVAGSNLTTLELAYNEFSSFISSAVSNINGDKAFTVTENTSVIKHYGHYYTDCPEFENGVLSGLSDAGDECIEYYYTGTTAAAYEAYCTKLVSEGYTLKVSNSNPGVTAAGYSSSKANVYVYFVPAESSVRIIVSGINATRFQLYPTKESVPEYKKITESKITQMALNYDLGNFGNCYIITLADGSFVVMDGGGYNADYGDDTRLFNLLKSLNKREDGKIVIAAYMLSHAHWDHYRNFYNFVSRYSSQIKIESCYVNLASDKAVYNSNNPDTGFRGCFNTMSSLQGGIPIVKLHTGMKFYVRNAEFEVIYTHEDIFPDRINYFNETSTVLRMTLEGTTVMFNGDAKNWASKGIVKRYGSYVKSDICTVAHHGYDGMTQSYYMTVAPKLLLWPTSVKNVETLRTGSTYAVDKYLWETLGKDNIIIAQPTQTVVLPYVPGTAPITEAY